VLEELFWVTVEEHETVVDVASSVWELKELATSELVVKLAAKALVDEELVRVVA
jgi:hypothetical protein